MLRFDIILQLIRDSYGLEVFMWRDGEVRCTARTYEGRDSPSRIQHLST